MKLLPLGATSALLAHHAATVAGQANTCAPAPLAFSDTAAVRVEKVGSVPNVHTDAFTYNMHVMDNVDGGYLFFLEQKEGVIFAYDHAAGTTARIFDLADPAQAIPPGLTLDWAYGGAAMTFRVKAVTRSRKADELVVVFCSSTLPPGWTAGDARLPPPGAYGKFVGNAAKSPLEWRGDIYRMGVIPDNFDNGAGLTTLTGYDVFYKYDFVNGVLSNPRPFFVSEVNVCPGHLGGGVETMDDGRILWSTGDCTVFGTEGHYAPQLDRETCGKILLIDPAVKGSFRIVAKGVRNSQQMRIVDAAVLGLPRLGYKRDLKSGKSSKKGHKGKGGKGGKDHRYLTFVDIGGVTAEEVNAVALHDLLADGPPLNFGWGRSLVDGRAREGTFYVEAGIPGVLGTEPPCAGAAPAGEAGFVQPWMQFGRTAEDFFYGISGHALPTSGVTTMRLLWTEFNTGKMLGTDEAFVPGAPPVTGYKLKVYDAAGNYLENGFNDLVKEELGDVGYYRGDPRLFHFPDGQAGVFIERTGAFYKITEIAAP